MTDTFTATIYTSNGWSFELTSPVDIATTMATISEIVASHANHIDVHSVSIEIYKTNADFDA